MKSIKTFAFASLVAFSTLAFVSCGGTSTTEAGADTTAIEVVPEDILQDETTNVVDDASMMEADTTATDSTSTEAGM